MKKIFFSSLLVLLTMIGIAPTVQAQSTPQYGEELLTNIPPAATDFTGWTTSSSDSECIPTCDEGWFKTCYTEGTISQTIDLAAKGYTTHVVANTLLLYAPVVLQKCMLISWMPREISFPQTMYSTAKAVLVQ